MTLTVHTIADVVKQVHNLAAGAVASGDEEFQVRVLREIERTVRYGLEKVPLTKRPTQQ